MKYKSPILKTITLSAVALALSACNDDSNDAQCSLSQEPNTVTLCIQSIPENTPSADEIYLAGTPNGWNAGDNLDKPIITLNREPNGYYSYDLHFDQNGQIHQFKFTRGSWAKAEVDAEGYDIANRNISFEGENKIVNLTIGGWADLQEGGESLGTRPTLSYGHVDKIEMVFPIDNNVDGDNDSSNDLKRTVRVWTPEGYDINRSQPYKVIYAFDGQNLFDKSQASYGMEWQLDETLHDKNADYIVVGLDSPVDIDTQPPGRRYVEYSTQDWTHPEIGPIHARGKETLDFLVNTIIPEIETDYNVSSKPEDRVLMGSSMGGYLTLTAMSYKQGIFNTGLALSHATTDTTNIDLLGNCSATVCKGYGGESIRESIANTGYANDASIYLDMGDQEVTSVSKSEEMLDGHLDMVETVKNTGVKVTQHVIIGGVHDEGAWAARFPAIYDEMLKN